MVLDDWTMCAHCNFPALLSMFRVVIQVERMCPMCAHSILDAEALKCVCIPS